MEKSEQLLITFFDNEEKCADQINRVFQKIAKNQKKLFESKKLLNFEVETKVLALETMKQYSEHLFTPLHKCLYLPHENPYQKCLDEKILPSLQTFQKNVIQTKGKINALIKSSQRLSSKQQKLDRFSESSKDPHKLNNELKVATELEQKQSQELVQQSIPTFIKEKVQQYQGLIQLMINVKMKQHAQQIELLTNFCQSLHQMNDSEIAKVIIKKQEKQQK